DWQKHFFENKLGILTPDGKNLCPFLERGKCSIYPVRPLICRRSVCGDHICNRLSIDFDSLGHWCNHEQVSRQLTLMNILYFDCDQNPPVEMGWTVKTGRADGSQNRIVTAPFEIWLLVLFDDCSWNRLLDTPGYRPLIKFADKSLKG
ncbi:MAG: YkgJ family cysteine cluster protein, partial [Bacillota bacterium]